MGDLAHTFIGGGTPATNNIEFWDGSIPWLQSSDLIEDIVFNIIPRKFISKKALKKSATKLIPSNSITIVTRVGVGKLALIPYEFATSQDFISFSELKLDLIFASYAFYRLMKEESKSTQGTSIKGITKEVILNKYIYVPKSKEEQTQIGNFFKQLDDTIALHQREFEKFKILRKAYLKHIFIDNTTQFRAEKTIPWEQRKLGDVVEIIGGGTPDTNNTAYWNGNIDWYSPTEIGNKPYVSGSLKKISVLGLQKSSAKILPANKTILFTSRAGIGDMAILTKQGTTNQGFQSFILKNDVDIYFLYSMGFKIKDFALKNASGSTFLEISKSQLSQMKLYLPSLKEQTQIGNFFKQLDDTIALHQKELAKYQQIKTACLEKMFVE